MRLKISGLNTAPIKFKHLWGRYPYGFRPWKHCIKCLVTNVANGIHPGMQDGEFEIEDRLFYLCGVGQELSPKLHPAMHQGLTNVHIVVRPNNGSLTEVGSLYGVTFRIEGGERIAIEPVPDDFRGLEKKHARCKNFQFGHQLFEDDPKGVVSTEVVYNLREPWCSVPIRNN